jgi:uncharacterized protein YaaN involved in tellurite resistance
MSAPLQHDATPLPALPPLDARDALRAADPAALEAPARAEVEAQVERFIACLLHEDLESDAFRSRLDGAFALGREEISLAATLMQGRLLQAGVAGLGDGPAFAAIQQMREELDRLDPGQGYGLLRPTKWLRLIPYGTRMRRYFRRFQSASSQLQLSLQQLHAARDGLQRDAIEIDVARARLADGMQRLRAAMHFAETLDERLALRVETLRATDAARARVLEQEVLFPARQNLQDMLTQQAVCANGYLALGVLRKTARDLMNGCSRIATTGLSALAVAQTVAAASGHQIRVMDMLGGVNASIEALLVGSARELGQHVERTGQLAQDPLVGIEKLKEMFEQTFKAMDAMDAFRSRAVTVMAQNNAVLREHVGRAERYFERLREAQAGELAHRQTAGPVAL